MLSTLDAGEQQFFSEAHWKSLRYFNFYRSETRWKLAAGLSAAANAPIPDAKWGVFRM